MDKMKTIATIVGARPQFIKSYPISRAFSASKLVNEILVHTGQHYDENMSAIFFDQLGLRHPDFNLGIGSGTQGYQTGRMLEEIEKVLMQVKPDMVLLYGDTNSTLAGALAAVKMQIPSAHVEAGLRSFNRTMPEEINRVVIDHVVNYCFCPTKTSVENLTREGIAGNVYLVGDVMYDAILQLSITAQNRSTILRMLKLKAKDYVLATVHRAENTNDPERLSKILDALTTISKELQVVFPIHPRTRQALAGLNSPIVNTGRLKILEPVGYLDMIELERNANLIVTDSGGVQKEAYFFRVPCVTLRDETEWVELVDIGVNKLASPANPNEMVQAMHSMVDAIFANIAPGIYGSGNAAEQITSILLNSD
jgi:UDP-GlcNAc3NAcA epimerase